MSHIFDINSNFMYVKGYKAHEATVFLANFSHDSSYLVTGDNDGVIFVWSLRNHKVCQRIEDAHDLGVTSGDCLPSTGKFKNVKNGDFKESHTVGPIDFVW